MVHPGLGVLSLCSSSPDFLLYTGYSQAAQGTNMGSASCVCLVSVCAPRVCVCASCLRVCLVYAWQALQQRHYIPSPESASDHNTAFSKSLGLSENQLFRHQSGVSVVVLQLSDGGTVSATLWVMVRVQDDSAEVQRLAWNPQ